MPAMHDGDVAEELYILAELERDRLLVRMIDRPGASASLSSIELEMLAVDRALPGDRNVVEILPQIRLLWK